MLVVERRYIDLKKLSENFFSLTKNPANQLLSSKFQHKYNQYYPLLSLYHSISGYNFSVNFGWIQGIGNKVALI